MVYVGIPPEEVAPSFASHGARNGCAQAAVSTLLAYWARHGSGLAPASVEAVYAAHPPDTWRALLGTTPWRLAAILRERGFRVERWSGPAGPARARLTAALAARVPVIVHLNLGALGNPYPTGHYVVAYGFDDEGVHCVNTVARGALRAPRDVIPWRPFLRAWRSGPALLPSYRHAAVAAVPALRGWRAGRPAPWEGLDRRGPQCRA